MSVSFVLHDFSEDPAPTSTALSGASVVIVATLPDPDIPGPRWTEDPGGRALRAAGLTRDGRRRAIHGLRVPFAWSGLRGSDAELLSAFHATCYGPMLAFYLLAPATSIGPVPRHAGAILQGGATMTPSLTAFPTDRIEIDTSQPCVFADVRFVGDLELTQVSQRGTTQGRFFDAVVPLSIERPWRVS